MDITPVLSESLQIVQGYGGGGFRIAGTDWQGSVLVQSAHTIPWTVKQFSDVTYESVRPLIEANEGFEILLIGCGDTQGFIKPSLRDALRRCGIAVDAMDTGAASRTFNILLSEERRVAAALIAV